MAYLGNAPVVGDSTNSFRLLDDIASFTVTFDATDTSVVSISGDTLSFTNHRFVTGQKVTYTDGGGTAIGGLTDGTSYFIIKVDQNTIKLATNASNAASSTAINLTSGAAGGSHTLKVAFDGTNTKFKATFNNGKKAKISRAAQITLSINGVIQQPQDSSSPSVGYGVEADSTIVFSTAPAATDKVFASFIGEVAASFDITDNTIDNFTGDGSTTIFNLSKEVPSNEDVLVTLDGVTQHPSDGSTTRSYSVINQALTFVSAPATGVAIQARHIGFAGATTSAVTGFYGRTGNAALTSTDDISVQNISGVGATFTSNVNIEGVLTYEDVTNVDSIGIITARAGVLVGSGITLSKDGDVFFTGIATGNGSGLTALNASNISSGTVPTARLGSGTASSSTFLRGDSSFQTVNTDLVSDTSPQLGGNLDVNTKNILFGDSSDGSSDDVLKFGAGNDLTIFHNGSASYIKDTGTGNLVLASSLLQITNAGVSENMAKFIENGAVELYHDNARKLSTYSSGIEIGATNAPFLIESTTNGAGTQDIARMGINRDNTSSSDRQMWSQITVAGDHAKFEIFARSANDTGTAGNFLSIDAVNSNVDIPRDNCELQIGASNDLKLYHNGTDSYIANGTSKLRIGNTNNDAIKFFTNNSTRWNINSDGHFIPDSNDTFDIGSSSYRVRDIYTGDLNLSNENKKDKGGNDVDGTWGDYTIQEGESDLFLINNRSGKKYKFNLTEVL